MNNITLFLNNASIIFWLLFIMCLIGVAIFLIIIIVSIGYLIARRYKKEMEIATGQDWFHRMCEDAYLKQQEKIDKIIGDLDK